MKALQIIEPGVVKTVKVEKPAPTAGEVLLRVRKVGLCGSDLTTYLGKNPMVSYPRIPGHEISAIVEESTTDVPDYIKVGQAVTVVPYTNCGSCSSCRRGRFNACKNNQTLGVQRDGALCEYITVPWQKLVLAENLDETLLAMVEPLTVGFHAADRAEVSDVDTVMILGCGMIGLGAIIRSAIRGAKVIAVDIDEAKIELAKKLGAVFGINSATCDFHSELIKLTRGEGPDVTIEAAGNPKTYLAAVNEVAFSGRVVCIGYAKDEVSFATKTFVQKEFDLRGSRNATPMDFQAVVDYLSKDNFPISQVVTHEVPLDDAGRILKLWAENPPDVTKILINIV